jgi:hypothetical protein
MTGQMPRDVSAESWRNPYRVTKRSADTLNLVAESRLYFNIHRPVDRETGEVGPPERRWSLVGGGVGWHEAMLEWANRFLDAGIIDYPRPAGVDIDMDSPHVRRKVRVGFTRAGRYLWQTWHHHPFLTIEARDREELLDKAATSLATAYVEESGLLEDRPDRYVVKLRPHAERVLDELTER